MSLGLIPNPQTSFVVILLVAGISLVIGLVLVETQVAATPSLTPSVVPGVTGGLLKGSPEEIVVRLSDVLSLSPDFEVREDKTGVVDNNAAARAWPDASSAQERYKRWGRRAGYVRYMWRSLPAYEDLAPVDIQSSVSTYDTTQGAQEAFQYYRKNLIGPNPHVVSIPPLGDNSAAFWVGNGPFISFLILFQKENGVASLLTTSFSERASLQVAVVLSDIMAERMR